MNHRLEDEGGQTENQLTQLLALYMLLVSDLFPALFFLIREGLHYKCYMSLIRLQQLPICVSGKQNHIQNYQTKELSVHALRHMTVCYSMLLM